MGIRSGSADGAEEPKVRSRETATRKVRRRVMDCTSIGRQRTRKALQRIRQRPEKRRSRSGTVVVHASQSTCTRDQGLRREVAGTEGLEFENAETKEEGCRLLRGSHTTRRAAAV